MENPYEKLKKLIEYPSIVGFRIIVDAEVLNSIGIIKDAIDTIEKDGMKEITDPPRKSSKGNYVSYTVPVRVTSPENLEAIYKKVGALPCVKHIL